MYKVQRQDSIVIEENITLTREELKTLLFRFYSNVKHTLNQAFEAVQGGDSDLETLPDIVKEQEKLIEEIDSETIYHDYLVEIKNFTKERSDFLKKKYEFLQLVFLRLVSIYRNFDNENDLESIYLFMRQLAKSLGLIYMFPAEERIAELRTHTNIIPDEYVYEASLPCSKLKKGMRIVDTGWKYEDVYFMFELQEDAIKDKIDDYGTISNCYVLRRVAHSKEGIIIYNDESKRILPSNMSFEEYDEDEDLYETVYFTSLEEAKSFGIDESTLKRTNLDYVFENE